MLTMKNVSWVLLKRTEFPFSAQQKKQQNNLWKHPKDVT